jgi:hypothetical protein
MTASHVAFNHSLKVSHNTPAIPTPSECFHPMIFRCSAI